ncbi:MAG: 30S ribosomal protein S21, partial [candidate division WWE3 bacterium GW2011_GWF2_43_18]
YRKPSELKRQKSKELERKFKFEKLRG